MREPSRWELSDGNIWGFKDVTDKPRDKLECVEDSADIFGCCFVPAQGLDEVVKAPLILEG